MYRFAGFEHGDEFREPRRPRGCILRVMKTIEDRVTVCAVEPLEELARGRRSRERFTQVVRDARRALRFISCVPTAVRFGRLDFGEPRRRHAALRDEFFRSLAIEFRPPALRAARREADQEIFVVERAELAVDPALRDRAVDGLLLRQALRPGAFLGELEP